jgi:uncharacterized protein (TIGR02099 family)
VPPDTHPDTPARPLERLQAVEHAVEAAVEQAIERTERTLAQRFGAGVVRALLLSLKTVVALLLVGYFAFAALLLVTRYVVMPRIDEARPWLEQRASRAIGAPLTIGYIDAGWRGVNPRLTLRDLRITGPEGQTRLALPQVEAEVSWTSVARASLQFAALTVVAPELEVRRLGPARFSVAGFVVEPRADRGSGGSPLLDWVLDQARIGIRDARVVYVDDAAAAVAPTGAATTTPGNQREHGAAPEPPRYDFTDVQLTLMGGFASTRLSLQARPPAQLAGSIDVRGDFRHGWLQPASDFAAWRGRLYVALDSADLARSEQVARLLPPGVTLDRAQGALRAWAQIDHAAFTSVTADVALSDVRAVLGPTLAPLEVAALSGRFTQREWGNAVRGGQDMQLQRLALHGEGLSMPPTDLKLRTTRGSSTTDATSGGTRPPRLEFEASVLSLDTLTRLAAQVPLAQALQQRIARQAVRGTLSNLKLDVDGSLNAPDRFALKTRFDALSTSAQPAEPATDAAGRPRAGLPGATNLAGTLDLTEAGGTLSLDSRDAVLSFPGVFEAPIALDRLAVQARFTREAGRLEVQLQNLALVNRDLDLSASGSYSRSEAAGSGPGSIDLTARVNAIDVGAAVGYVPLATGPQTRSWLARALVSGRGSDGSVRLRGDLREFPFRDARRGEFRASLRVRDAVLDYLPEVTRDDGSVRPSWPRIEDIDADLVFERQGLAVTARGARIFGTRLQAASARIAELNHPESTLVVRGSSNGPAADLLRYVTESSLKEPLRFLTTASATGSARLDLRLDIPLTHARDTTVAGSVQLAGNDIVLSPEIPPLSRASGRVEFTQRSLALSNISAGFVGGQLTASGTQRPDAPLVITGSGTAAPAAIARLVDVPPVQRLLARTQGLTRYAGTVTMRGGRTDLRVDTDLAGWAIDAPSPLGKIAAEQVPTRVELTGLGSERDQIAVTVGSALAVRMERARVGERAMRVERGVIGVGEPAPLPAQGLIAHVVLPRVDFDAWQPLLEGAEAAPPLSTAAAAPARGAGSAAAGPDFVNLRTRELVFHGKPIANVVLGATRVTEAGEPVWLANVTSDHVNGALSWRPAAAGGSGRVVARLSRLTIPEGQRSQVAQLLDAPPTDVPGVDVIAENFELGGRALGRLELLAVNTGSPAQPVWTMQKLELAAPEAKMSASGSWQREPGAPASAPRRMSLSFGLDFSNGGALLTRLGIAGALRGGTGRLQGELGWRGSPFAIHYPTLSGTLKLNTTKGQFLKADAGAGRLLGVLSLQSLPRRITLDFRDVFSEGFAFDSIGATAQLSSGVLTTRDFRMRGASANVLIEGSADVGRETQNLHVLVLPEINAGSASLAYALLANPAIGLGTFLAQLVLRDPLSKAFSFEYDVTGTWADPQVKRRERSGPEAAGSPAPGQN